ERAGHDAGLRARDELPPRMGVLRQRLSAMDGMYPVRSYLSGILLAKLPHVLVRRGLQALRRARTQPLRKPPHRSIGGQRHEKVPCRSAFRLRTQLRDAFRVDALLAGKERCDDKGGGRAAGRRRPRSETTDKISEKMKQRIIRNMRRFVPAV